jgi:PAS domain S-box-containing protein
MAGVLFQSSRIWEGDWWWWHVVRLVASMIVLGQTFLIYQETEEELESMNATLERRVAERSETAELRARALTRANEQLNREIRERESVGQALRDSERRYHQFIEGARDAIVIADERGLITYFNAAAREIFGYSECEAVGRPLALLMPPEFAEAHENGLRRYVQTREPHLIGRTVEVRGRRKNGETFPLDLSLSALELPEGVGFLGAIRDVTQRHNMQARILQTEKLASLGLLSAGMAHEINNPLAYVASNLAVLQRDIRGLIAVLGAYEESREFLECSRPEVAEKVARLAEEVELPYVKETIEPILATTREGVKRVADIVKSLRGFARLDQAKFDRVDLHDGITASLEMIRGRLKRHNIAVEERFGDLPLIACAPAQINQVILNLLVNAMHAIEGAQKESGRITIRTRTDGEEAVLEIEDDGPGIPPEVLPRIFDPFFTTKAFGKGTGLGLSISHGIVSDHGGRIEVESVPGRETRVRVILPIKGKESAS